MTLQFDFKKRPTADQLLQHPYFTEFISQGKIQEALDIVHGKKRAREPSGKREPVYESLKIGPEGITIKKETEDELRQRQKKSLDRNKSIKKLPDEVPQQEIEIAQMIDNRAQLQDISDIPMPGFERKATDKRKMQVRRKKSNPNQIQERQ